MPESNEILIGTKHSFLFWLIIPIIPVWLAISYIFGAIKSPKPLWQQASFPPSLSNTVLPYETTYPPIKTPSRGVVTIWFDNAWASQYMIAQPILKKRGLIAAIGVPTKYIGEKAYLNWAQLRSLQLGGWEITNQSAFHDCGMNNWPVEMITQELETSTKMLWENQLPSDHFVTPCGVQSPVLLEEIKKKFISMLTAEPGFNDINKLDPYGLKVRDVNSKTSYGEVIGWINEAERNNFWLILVFHNIRAAGTADELSDVYTINETQLTKIADYIVTSDIQVAVPSQVLYLRDSL